MSASSCLTQSSKRQKTETNESENFDEEENDDFDSLFFSKYKKVGGKPVFSTHQRFARFNNGCEGLSVIPELATDLVTSTEFG